MFNDCGCRQAGGLLGQEYCHTWCQPELAGSQVSCGNTWVIFATWVYATRRCSFQAVATTELVLSTENISALCTTRESLTISKSVIKKGSKAWMLQ